MVSLKSKISQKVLGYFFLNPAAQLYVNEIASTLGLDKRNLVKKLREFEKEGLLIQHAAGNMKLYAVNKKYPFYREYKKIILSTAGVEEFLRKIMAGVPGILEAYIFGSYARDTMDSHSDIDILVVGTQSVLALQQKLTALQKELGREINAVNMAPVEYERKKSQKDPFLTGIMGSPKIRIFP